MFEEGCEEIHLIALSWVAEFLITLHEPINSLQKPHKDFKLVYSLIAVYVEN